MSINSLSNFIALALPLNGTTEIKNRNSLLEKVGWKDGIIGYPNNKIMLATSPVLAMANR